MGTRGVRGTSVQEVQARAGARDMRVDVRGVRRCKDIRGYKGCKDRCKGCKGCDSRCEGCKGCEGSVN